MIKDPFKELIGHDVVIKLNEAKGRISALVYQRYANQPLFDVEYSDGSGNIQIRRLAVDEFKLVERSDGIRGFGV